MGMKTVALWAFTICIPHYSCD